MDKKSVKELIWLLLKDNIPFQVVAAKVASVDKGKKTCDLTQEEGPEIFDARLMAINDSVSNYTVIYPQNNSYVLAICIMNQSDEAYILAVSEVESVECKIGNISLTIDNTKAQFNDGSLGGLLDLPTFLLSYNANLAAIKTAVSAGFAAVDTALNSLAPGSGTSATVFNSSAASIQDIQRANVENTKVKHG